MRKKLAFGIALLGVASTTAWAQPATVNGVIGSEWNGVSVASVGFNSAAPQGNFGTPTAENHNAAYEIRMRADASYLYTAVNTIGGSVTPLNFANLYYSLRYGAGPVGNGGSSIGFEVTNDRAFKPGLGGYFTDTDGATGGLIQWATSSAGGVDVIEVAIDLSVFLGNALGVANYGLPSGETLAGIRLNLSQSFGYSVAGGDTYGDNRLGFVPLAATTVPEPSTYALMGAGLLALGVAARRRRNA